MDNKILGCALVFVFGVSAQGVAQNNGLTAEEQSTWHHLSQGTEFFPLLFLAALRDDDTGEPFMKNLERFGFIPDKKSPNNPYGLPVGMTIARARDIPLKIDMVGINCAGCHTAVLEMGGLPAVWADGGTNLFDSDGFRTSLIKSFENTIDNPLKLTAFLIRLVENPLFQTFQRDNGQAEELNVGKLVKLIQNLKMDKLQEFVRQEKQDKSLNMTRGVLAPSDGARQLDAASAVKRALALKPIEGDRNGDVSVNMRLLLARWQALKIASFAVGKTPPGFGRVDAFGSARNLLLFGKEQPLPLDAPVRYPFLWTIKDSLKWYHWDGNTMSRLERNTGEALGVGAAFDATSKESTINFKNLELLEALAMKLTPPTWPNGFPAIDQDKATKGAKIFAKLCAGCHSGPLADGSKITPLTDIQTDPNRVRSIRRPVGKDSFFDFQSPILKAAILKGTGVDQGTKNLWRPSRDLEPDLPEGYSNRPLPAIWASPPYLHNGSVPNLYQLLLPAEGPVGSEVRVKTFKLGHREYDPKMLGYTLDPAPNPVLFTFDTRWPGNSNTGHSGTKYGTSLTADERWQLIEYLKVHRDDSGRKTSNDGGLRSITWKPVISAACRTGPNWLTLRLRRK